MSALTLFKEQSPYLSVLLGQTKPEGFSPRAASDPTKHKGNVIVPIIKHLDRAVCLTQQNMAAILGGLFASPNKTWLAIQPIKLQEISVLLL